MADTKDGKSGKFEKLLRWSVGVNATEVQARVRGLRAQYPRDDSGGLAKKVYSRAAWKASAVGAGTGFPSNPLVALPAAMADVCYVLHIEVAAAACVAEIFEPGYLDDGEIPWELLVPILNLNGVSQAAREFAVLAGQQATKRAIQAVLKKNGLETFKKIVRKVIGKRVARKAIASKMVPFVGVGIGAVWNWSEVTFQGARVVRYFERRSGPVGEPSLA